MSYVVSTKFSLNSSYKTTFTPSCLITFCIFSIFSLPFHQQCNYNTHYDVISIRKNYSRFHFHVKYTKNMFALIPQGICTVSLNACMYHAILIMQGISRGFTKIRCTSFCVEFIFIHFLTPLIPQYNI